MNRKRMAAVGPVTDYRNHLTEWRDENGNDLIAEAAAASQALFEAYRGWTEPPGAFEIRNAAENAGVSFDFTCAHMAMYLPDALLPEGIRRAAPEISPGVFLSPEEQKVFEESGEFPEWVDALPEYWKEERAFKERNV